MRNGALHYTSRFGSGSVVNMTIEDVFVSDGSWHNVTLVSRQQSLRMMLDGQAVGDELDTLIVHDFLDPYLTTVVVGASDKDVNGISDSPSGWYPVILF